MVDRDHPHVDVRHIGAHIEVAQSVEAGRGALKLLSTYPSNMKLNSVPHCLRGERGGGTGAGAAAGVGPAGGLSGVCARTPTAPPKRNPRTRVVQYVPRMILLQSFEPEWSLRMDGAWVVARSRDRKSDVY